MRKDRIYKLFLFLDLNTSDIISAECGCPAGKGPCASCKHIGALCYALEEFSRLGKLPEFLTATEKLQEWNRPRPKTLTMIPVADLAARSSDILLREGKGSSLSTFDPRQPHHRMLGTAALDYHLTSPVLSLTFWFHYLTKSHMITHIHCHQKTKKEK